MRFPSRQISTASASRGRCVDVQQRAGRERHALELLHDACSEERALLEAELLAEAEVHLAGGRLLREGDGGQPEQDPLQRRRDRARVGDVVAQVRAVVGARDDHLRLEALHEPGGREPDAVDRCAVGRVAVGAVPELDALDPQRPARRDRTPGRRPVAVRRDDHELDVRDLQQLAPQRLQPLGLDAVVVGEQDPHSPECTNQRISARAATGRSALRRTPRRRTRSPSRRGRPTRCSGSGTWRAGTPP